MTNFNSTTRTSQISAFVLTFLLFIVGKSIMGQASISGFVSDQSKLGLPGVNLYIQGSYDGTSSNIDGQFHFGTSFQDSQILVATFIGMDTFKRVIFLDGENIEVNLELKASRTQLNEIVVSAGLIEASSDKKRAAALSPMDIVLVASASADIAGAMNLLPGTTRNGETGEVLVRGGAGYETKTYIDGLLVDKPYNSTVSNVAARNRFSPFMFKGTSFSTGGYGAEYGQAMSSALLLHTSDLAPKTNTGLMLLSVGGSLSHTQRWTDQSLHVAAEYTNLTPYFALMPQDREWIKAPSSKGLQVNYKKSLSENGGMFKFYTNANTSAMQLIDDKSNQSVRLQNNYLYLNTSIKNTLGDWLYFAGIAASKSKDEINAYWTNQEQHQSLQARFTAQRDIGSKMRFKFGLEQVAGKYSDVFIEPLEGDESSFLIKDIIGASFAQMDFQLSDQLVGRVGGRYEYNSIDQSSKLSPRISMAYKIGKKEQFSIAYGDYYQRPNYEEFKLNRDLSQEKATHLLVNYQKVSKDYVFRLEAYQKWYNDLIKYSPSSADNSGKGYARGLDVFFRDNSSLKNGDYWITYSYLDTKRDWKNFPQEARPDFAMGHSLSLAYKQFFPSSNMAFSTSYAVHSGRPYYDPTLPIESFNTSRTPIYNDVSSTLTYLTNIGGNFTVFYLSVTNILGFDQTFGYEYASLPDGSHSKQAIQPSSKRMAVMAIVMNFGEEYKKDEVTSEDY